MTIRHGSRYENATLVRVTDDDGITRPTVYRGVPVVPTSYKPYITKSGDRIEQLAHFFYQNAQLWWVIADANPEIGYPDNIQGGLVLRIP